MIEDRRIVRIADLSRSYGGTSALRGVDLQVERGEFVSLVGRSGSGKSTLLNIIGLLDQPSGGEYDLLGMDICVSSETELARLRAQHLGFVFQSFHLMEDRTLAENVGLGALYLGWPRRRRRDRAATLLTELGLGDLLERHPNTLSGGERQRVAIARALMGDPELLLCDEPTGNLDTENSAIVLEVLRTLNLAGTTVLLVTHDNELAQQADRTIRLQDGLIVDPTEIASASS